MRIISGKYKGQLVSFQAGHIRPTTDRVKESLFNILGGTCEGLTVLDLFSGTGSLGFEALSRGAVSCHFVESNRKSIDIIRRNQDKLKIQEPVQITSKDVLSFVRNYKGQPFDLIFIDPPFTEEMADEVMQAVSGVSALFSPQTVLSIESGRREKIGQDYGALLRYDQREFGDKFLSFFRWEQAE